MSGRLVISAALAGAATMKEQNPATPYTPEEFAEESYKCMNEGASVVHIHVRDPDTGRPTADLTKIGATVSAIRERCPGLLLNLSTAISPEATPEQRIAPVATYAPDLASLNTNSMNAALANRKTGQILAEYVFTNTFAQITQYAAVMEEHSVKPELEVYDFGGMYNVHILQKQQFSPEPLHFQMVFGLVGGVPRAPERSASSPVTCGFVRGVIGVACVTDVAFGAGMGLFRPAISARTTPADAILADHRQCFPTGPGWPAAGPARDGARPA